MPSDDVADGDGIGTTLRVGGTSLDISALLSQIRIKPCAVFRKGHPVNSICSHLAKRNGANFAIRNASGRDLPKHISETIDFLKAHQEDLLAIRQFPGIDSLNIDFSTPSENELIRNLYLPADLVTLAAKFGCSINISMYAIAE